MKKNKLSSKITREIDSDGSQRFSGNGGGVLLILSDGRAMVIPPNEKRRQGIELLWETWNRDPLTSGTIDQDALEQKKGCAQIMLKALYEGDAAFFRELGDTMKPRPAAIEIAKRRKLKPDSKFKRDNEVLNSIFKATNEAGTLPFLEDVLELFRKTKGNADTTPAHFKRRLKARGFEWLGENRKMMK
jgi:hypothetical protein